MHRSLLVLAVAGQLAVLAFMVYGKESLMWTGERIYLQTAPIDPRDPFRGDFVRLRYPMNNLAHVELQIDEQSDTGSTGDLSRDQRVYAVLKPIAGDREQLADGTSNTKRTHEVAYVTDEAPDGGLFLRGRVSKKGNARQLPARFGIEQLFVQQGRGIEMEETLGVRGGVQIPLEVELAVGSSGAATIVGHRFGRLGMQLEFLDESTVENETGNPNRTIGVRISVVNVSDATWMIPDPTHRCAWSLRPVLIHDPGKFVEAHDCSERSNSVSMITMDPGQSINVDILFDDELWFVMPPKVELPSESNSSDAGNLGQLAPGQLFRFVLLPPEAIGVAHEESENVWRGKLYSQAFNGRGVID